MPRFFLNIINARGALTDEEGFEAPDLARACEMGMASLRGALSHEVLSGTLDLRGQLDIIDAAGRVAATFPFSDAVRVVFPEPARPDQGQSRPGPDAGTAG